MTTTEKLIAIIDKEKDIQKIIQSHKELTDHVSKKVEEYRKGLIEAAEKLPKINNGK